MKKVTYSLIISLLIFCCIGWSFRVIAAIYDPTVETAQQRLTELGYDPGPVDGKMGKKTENAVKQFQQDNGLAVTGEIDKETIRNLNVTGSDRTSAEDKQPQKQSPSERKTQDPGKPEILMIDRQVVIGSEREVIIAGKGFTDLLSIEISPPDNLEIKEIKKVDIPTGYKESGYQGWAVLINADKQAEIGSRNVVLKTSHGTLEVDETNFLQGFFDTPLEKIIYVNRFDFQVAGITLRSQNPYSCTAEYEIDLIVDSGILPEEILIKWTMIASTQVFFSNLLYSGDSLVKIEGNRYKLPSGETNFSGIRGCQGSHVMWLDVSDQKGSHASSVAEMNWDEGSTK